MSSFMCISIFMHLDVEFCIYLKTDSSSRDIKTAVKVDVCLIETAH